MQEHVSPFHEAPAAFKESIPVMMGYIPLGLVYGFLFSQAGGDWYMASIASMMIFGGAAQYMMVPMLAAGVSVAGIAFATFVINLRHIFYGISILHKIPQSGWKRWYIVYCLTDETYSQLSIMPEDTPKDRMVWLAFFNHLWWITGGTVGALIGAAAKFELNGIDFVLTSLFAMLTCEQWRQRKSSWPLWSALIAYIPARILVPENSLAVSIALCVAAGLVWGWCNKKKCGTPINLEAGKES